MCTDASWELSFKLKSNDGTKRTLSLKASSEWEKRPHIISAIECIGTDFAVMLRTIYDYGHLVPGEHGMERIPMIFQEELLDGGK